MKTQHKHLLLSLAVLVPQALIVAAWILYDDIISRFSVHRIPMDSIGYYTTVYVFTPLVGFLALFPKKRRLHWTAVAYILILFSTLLLIVMALVNLSYLIPWKH